MNLPAKRRRKTRWYRFLTWVTRWNYMPPTEIRCAILREDLGLDEDADVYSLNEIEYAVDEDGWYCGSIKGREGIITQGRTLEEFCLMIEDARRLMDGESGEDHQ